MIRKFLKVWEPVFVQQSGSGSKTKIPGITHPKYDASRKDWVKFRFTFEGGRKFINKYLKKFSRRENTTDFSNRREITYCPGHAKAAVVEIKNAIYQRMVDVSRKDGPETYQKAIEGEERGVDFNGNDMNGFIGRLVLPELLSMSRVGVFVDKFPQDANADMNTARSNRPYLYIYKTEQIRSWTQNESGVLTSVLLEDENEVIHQETGLVVGTSKQYRHLRLVRVNDGLQVLVKIYDKDGKEVRTAFIDIPVIPLVIFELSQSLLTDVADYQVALLNMGSSDINYSLKANFPFYTEQFDAAQELAYNRQATTSSDVYDAQSAQVSDSQGNPGTSENAQKAKNREASVGAVAGRRYPKGMERPGFIHPSAEPLNASMKKQEELRKEIRQLVNLNVMTLVPMRASAESRQASDRGLESGLSYIGMELEYGERLISEIWAHYEGQGGQSATIGYPNNYSLKTDEDRRKEAKELNGTMQQSPSKTYQKETAKRISTILIGHKVKSDTLDKIHKEIEEAEVVVIDPDIIAQDHENGFVSTKTASIARGYPENEVDQAKEDHAERAARILVAQSKVSAGGVKDLDENNDGNRKED